KKYAIADLEVTLGDDKHLDVCVIAHNWMSEDGENCLYPTYLAPKKQGIAAKKCMEPTAKFNTYPATILLSHALIIYFLDFDHCTDTLILFLFLVTYEEARRKLERAVEKTDLESDADRDKGNRGFRKRKHLTDLSWSEDEGDENPTKVGKSQPASQKGISLPLPTFTFSTGAGETEDSRKTSDGSTSCLAATVSKGYNLPSTESQSTHAQTKDKGLDFGSITSDITKSQMSSTVSLTPSPRGALKTMTALPKRLSLNVNQPDSSNSKKQLNRGSKTSVNVSKSNINTKKKQFSQSKDRISDKEPIGKLQKFAKKHSNVSKHKNKKK
ncbi:uncharacterized protein LOC112462962, partial [Temnothorax curvispinosus]|uniref:Uncharacterized protein LOC112462962 n=1 Tax=Temnothorax curvispinosus TaxID=300111 RepID=A0A6J1QW04_9HYME